MDHSRDSGSGYPLHREPSSSHVIRGPELGDTHTAWKIPDWAVLYIRLEGTFAVDDYFRESGENAGDPAPIELFHKDLIGYYIVVLTGFDVNNRRWTAYSSINARDFGSDHRRIEFNTLWQ